LEISRILSILLSENEGLQTSTPLPTMVTVAQLKFYLGDFWAKLPAVATFVAFWANLNLGINKLLPYI
jgi:hypothetical protein